MLPSILFTEFSDSLYAKYQTLNLKMSKVVDIYARTINIQKPTIEIVIIANIAKNLEAMNDNAAIIQTGIHKNIRKLSTTLIFKINIKKYNLRANPIFRNTIFEDFQNASNIHNHSTIIIYFVNELNTLIVDAIINRKAKKYEIISILSTHMNLIENRYILNTLNIFNELNVLEYSNIGKNEYSHFQKASQIVTSLSQFLQFILCITAISNRGFITT